MRNNQANKTRPDTTGEFLHKGLASLAIICKVAVFRVRAWLGRLGSEITRLIFQAAAGAAKISRVLAFDFIYLGLTITGLALAVSVMIGIISPLLMLRRFFYLGRPLLVKLAWAGAVGAVAAYELGYYYPNKF